MKIKKYEYKRLYDIEVNNSPIEILKFALYNRNTQKRNKFIRIINRELKEFEIKFSFDKKEKMSGYDKRILKCKKDYETEEEKLFENFNKTVFINNLYKAINRIMMLSKGEKVDERLYKSINR